MPRSESTTIKLEAKKSYVWLQTVDGSIQQVEEEVAMFCPMICRELLRTGMGSSKTTAISLPKQVSPSILSSIFDYCRFHQVPGRSDKERKSFNEKFIKTDTDQLCELISAAYNLEIRPLVDLTSWAIARVMEGRTNEEIRDIFHLPDDLTEEEKLEPLKNPTNDPYIRLLNQHLARKRKNLKEQQESENAESQIKQEDQRSVEELLELINATDGADSKCVKPSKQKKNRRRKNQVKDSFQKGNHKTSVKDSTGFSKVSCQCDDILSHNAISTSQDGSDDQFSTDMDMDDDLDQEKMKENDRIVAEFARRLSLIGYLEGTNIQ